MTTANHRPSAIRFSSDDIPEHDRLEYVREVYARMIVRHDLEPARDDPFHVRGSLRKLPGLGLASMATSKMQVRRTRSQIDSDDLVLNVTVAGSRIHRQLGREAELNEGDAVLGAGAHLGTTDVRGKSRFLSIRMPFNVLAPMIADLDSVLIRPIRAGNGPLSLLVGLLGALHEAEAILTPELQHLVVGNVLDLVALTLGATRDAAEIARGRGVRVARLGAVKADIAARLSRPGLSLDAVAARQGVSPRYVRKLFESERMSFSEFVLGQRLVRAHRMLSDPRMADRAIDSIAFAVGFGDLSYFNRTFRRRFGASPSDVREEARREGGW